MIRKNKLKIIPLGGLFEVGKNMTLVEYKDDIIIIDCGLTFPDQDMLGVDIVIPDITYLEENKEKIRGIFLTHGHEDHIGAVPYVVKKIDTNIYCSKLTKGLLESKFKEHGLNTNIIKQVNVNNTVKSGVFSCEFIRVSHSIPDSCAISVKTPMGVVLFTGDYKMDFTPIDGEVTDIQRLAEIGRKGVLCLMAESTNVERAGYTMSEKTVGETFIDLFAKAKSRIIVATFASNLHRVQQVIYAAEKFGRKIILSGRSMVNNINIACNLGYIKVNKNTIIDINSLNKYSDDEIVILSTGTQGEPLSALTRMANGEHKKISLKSDDMVILSASAIPGNEISINNTINKLTKLGVNIIYQSLADVHVSGHACQEEIKLMYQLIMPKYYIPMHGEIRQLSKNAKLIESMGMPKENILVGNNGTVFEFTKKSGRIAGEVQAGNVLVDGSGVGDVGNVVLKDRKHLSEDGLLVVSVTFDKKTHKVIAGPEIISRGFIYVKESQDIIDGAKKIVLKTLDNCNKDNVYAISQIKYYIRDALKNYVYSRTKRDPMILPVISEKQYAKYKQ